MIGAVLVALQLAATTPSVLSVRAGESESIVPLVETNLGAAISIERLAPLVPLSLSDLGNGRFAVNVAGVDMELTDQRDQVGEPASPHERDHGAGGHGVLERRQRYGGEDHGPRDDGVAVQRRPLQQPQEVAQRRTSPPGPYASPGSRYWSSLRSG